MARKKVSTRKKPIAAEEHHRRPRSLGGSNDLSNIAYVKGTPHKKWHILFGNLNAVQICNALNASKWKPIRITVVCEFLGGEQVSVMGWEKSTNEENCDKAWKKLFRGQTFSETIAYMNNVWLDPAYRFVLKR